MAVVGATLLVSGNSEPAADSATSLAASAVKLRIGVALVVVGIRRWIADRPPEEAEEGPSLAKWRRPHVDLVSHGARLPHPAVASHRCRS